MSEFTFRLSGIVGRGAMPDTGPGKPTDDEIGGLAGAERARWAFLRLTLFDVLASARPR